MRQWRSSARQHKKESDATHCASLPDTDHGHRLADGARKNSVLAPADEPAAPRGCSEGRRAARFIYIAVTLDERNRCAEACPDLTFREPVAAAKQKPRKNARMATIKARAEAAKADQEREHERKYASLVQLVKRGQTSLRHTPCSNCFGRI